MQMGWRIAVAGFHRADGFIDFVQARTRFRQLICSYGDFRWPRSLRFSPNDRLANLDRANHSLQTWIRQPVLRIPLSTWMLALVLVCGVIAFFRFYDLSHLPFDMVSDHAEKLYDVQDLLDGQAQVFFERNTGREAFQFYWTALMVKLFGTGHQLHELKLGTVLAGLITLYFIYRWVNELGGRWVWFICAPLCRGGILGQHHLAHRLAFRCIPLCRAG